MPLAYTDSHGAAGEHFRVMIMGPIESTKKLYGSTHNLTKAAWCSDTYYPFNLNEYPISVYHITSGLLEAHVATKYKTESYLNKKILRNAE